MKNRTLRIVAVLIALIGCMGLTSCGLPPNEKTQARIVTAIHHEFGAVRSFRFLPTVNRCAVDFECYIIPYEGEEGMYRGYAGFGHVHYELITPAEEGGVDP